MQTPQWPLSDHSSMHSRYWELYGTEVLLLTSAVHAMEDGQDIPACQISGHPSQAL